MQITTYNFDTAAVRVLEGDNREPWFVASDVCAVLTIGAESIRRLDEDEKGLRNVQTLGGEQSMAVINESGLYSLILTSRKPEAKRFKKWVTSEVLPSIRKTGSYSMAQTQDPEVQRLVALRDSGVLSQSKCETAAFLLLGLIDPREDQMQAEVEPVVPKDEPKTAERLPEFLRIMRVRTKSGLRIKPRKKFLGKPKPVQLNDLGRAFMAFEDGLECTARKLERYVVGGYFEVRRGMYEYDIDTITGVSTANGARFVAGYRGGNGATVWKAQKLLGHIAGLK